MNDVVRDGDDMALQALLASVDRPMSEALQARARAVGRKHFGPGTLGDLLPDGTVIGSYTLERVLGEGGQAVVYLGRHRRLPGRLSAIKIPHGAETGRMLKEADVMARLDHPGILGIVDADAEAEPPYLILEYCVGGSLADQVETHGPLPVAVAARVARAVAEALACAHAQGIVHRDLKPENILFDSQGNPRIADFGLGKVVAERISLSLSQASHTGVAGTPVYMAPEQEWPGTTVDHRADLFALGKLIYFMLTGETPRTLKPVERVREDLDPAWSDLIFKLTATKPDERHPDAGSVIADLNALTGDPRALVKVEPPRPQRTEAPLTKGPRIELNFEAPRQALPGKRWVAILSWLAYTTSFFLLMATAITFIAEGISTALIVGIVCAFAYWGGELLEEAAYGLEAKRKAAKQLKKEQRRAAKEEARLAKEQAKRAKEEARRAAADDPAS